MRKLTRASLAKADILEKLQHRIYSKKLDIILQDLDTNNLNTSGKEEILRDRLLRYRKRVIGIEQAPWHEITDVKSLSSDVIKKIVKNYEPQRVVTEIEKNSCNASGNLIFLRNRLTRFFLKFLNYEARWSNADLFLKRKKISPKTQVITSRCQVKIVKTTYQRDPRNEINPTQIVNSTPLQCQTTKAKITKVK